MRQAIAAFGTGVLFAIGLGISGMTLPEKVQGFLDFTGDWDPALAFVMGGAVMVYFAFFKLVTRRKSPLLGEKFSLPTKKDITPKLIGGASLFGIGWGLAGFCPGPALTSVGGGIAPVAIFVASMVGGMYLYRYVDALVSKPSSDVEQHDVPETVELQTSTPKNK